MSKRAGWKNIWLEVTIHWPNTAKFVHHDQEPIIFLCHLTQLSLEAFYHMTTEFWKFQKSCFNLISTWYKGAQGTKRFYNIKFSSVFLSQNKKLTIPRKCNFVLLTSLFCYVFATNPCDWTTFKGPAHVKPFSTC